MLFSQRQLCIKFRTRLAINIKVLLFFDISRVIMELFSNLTEIQQKKQTKFHYSRLLQKPDYCNELQLQNVMPQCSNGQTTSTCCFAYIIFQFTQSSPPLSYLHLCMYRQHLHVWFLQLHYPRQALRAFSSETPISPFILGACLCTFQFLLFSPQNRWLFLKHTK